MKETIKKFFQTKQAKIGLAVLGIVVVLAAAFFLQQTPNQGLPVANTPSSSSAESQEDSTIPPDGSQTESGSTAANETQEAETSTSSAPSSETSSEAPSGDKPTASSGGTTSSSQQPSSSSGMEIDPETGKDKYQTDPVPEGKPTPVEPEDAVIDESKKLTCTLSIRCDTILNNMDMLKEEKKALVPGDGVILATTTVTFSEGESVFDVLKRMTREQRIHMEFEFTPIYNSAYIEGIANLYEFDCGNLSGWMYKVNGWFPNYGCSRYQLKQGDVIEWVYTCDLGKDVGGGYATGQGGS